MDDDPDKTRKKVPLLEGVLFSITFVALIFGSTVGLRQYFELPARELTTAFVLALKDFLLLSLLFILFEHRQQNPHNIRYGLSMGLLFGCVTFVCWMWIL